MTELEKKVLTWLEDSGYALELEVARTFQVAGCEVSTGDFARDRNSGKLREIDCIAEHNMGVVVNEDIVRAYFSRAISVVECKTGKKPWVVFADPDSVANDRTEDDLGVMPEEVISNGWGAAALWLAFRSGRKTDEAVFRRGPNPCYGGVAALKPSGEDNIDEFYRAVSQCVAGAAAVAERLEPGENQDRHDAKIVFPVVVTAGSLLKTWMSPSGGLEVATISHARLRWCGTDACAMRAPFVDVVTRDGLPEFARMRSAEKALLAKELEKQVGKIRTALSHGSLGPLKLHDDVLRRDYEQGHAPSLLLSHPRLSAEWKRIRDHAVD